MEEKTETIYGIDNTVSVFSSNALQESKRDMIVVVVMMIHYHL